MGWNYLSIPKLQRLHRWSLGMDKKSHPLLYWACDYLSMLVLKLNHISKSGPRWHASVYLCSSGLSQRHWSWPKSQALQWGHMSVKISQIAPRLFVQLVVLATSKEGKSTSDQWITLKWPVMYKAFSMMTSSNGNISTLQPFVRGIHR